MSRNRSGAAKGFVSVSMSLVLGSTGPNAGVSRVLASSLRHLRRDNGTGNSREGDTLERTGLAADAPEVPDQERLRFASLARWSIGCQSRAAKCFASSAM